jgi:hypothetical protein
MEHTVKKTKGKASKTSITFLLDRTGSMSSIKDDTIKAFNSYLDSVGETKGDIEFSLIQFDSVSLDKCCVRVPIAEATRLNNGNYQPRSTTPLIDAAYKTIKAVEESLNGQKPKVIICIQTDGYENASTEYNWDQLNTLIKEKTLLGWQFNFIGAGIDAYNTGARMGIAPMATMSYDLAQSANAMRGLAQSHSGYASGQSVNSHISMATRGLSGDVHAANYGVGGSPIPTPPVTVKPVTPPAKAKKPARSLVDSFKL